MLDATPKMTTRSVEIRGCGLGFRKLEALAGVVSQRVAFPYRSRSGIAANRLAEQANRHPLTIPENVEATTYEAEEPPA
jgi:hypothetical protein